MVATTCAGPAAPSSSMTLGSASALMSEARPPAGSLARVRTLSLQLFSSSSRWILPARASHLRTEPGEVWSAVRRSGEASWASQMASRATKLYLCRTGRQHQVDVVQGPPAGGCSIRAHGSTCMHSIWQTCAGGQASGISSSHKQPWWWCCTETCARGVVSCC